MDELRSFFNDPCPSSSQVKFVRGGVTGGLRLTKEDEIEKLTRRKDHRHTLVPTGTDYAREVKQRETEMYVKNEIERGKWESISGGLESLEQLSTIGASVLNLGELTDEAMTEVYSKYSFQKREDSTKLAIEEFKQEILDRINGFPVTIIEGPTGCGKTTQVPQWILDDCYQKRKPCKIIVTQPRKIAAITIARRVAQERGWDVGGLVGYQVGLDKKIFNDTRICYVTTGILLQKLVGAKKLDEFTHIVLDEVHERGQEMDFLLLVVRRLLYTVSPRVKVILMSATFKKKAFADYFTIPSPDGHDMASCIEVVKKEPTYSVKIFYLNNLTKFGAILQQATPKEEPTILPEMHQLVVKLINAFEQIDKQEDRYEDRSTADLPSVLVFLPGINEIEDLYECLTNPQLKAKVSDAECTNYKWLVLPLHSTITSEEQARVFQRASPGTRKIILATNIAESSITVPDIKYVIDYCLIKQLVADPSTNFTTLTMCWASKTNCEQRAGRAGRVRDGRVYRLVNDKFYENFSQECTPEILRCPLERLVLLAKLLDIGPPSDTLALAMDPPDMSNIHRTILVLKEIGGLKKTLGEEWCPSDGDITYLGRIMARLPLDVRASKMIVLGHIYGHLEETIIMAAAMAVKNIFNNPFRERLNAYNSKLTWADGSTSDCIAFLRVYQVWHILHKQKNFSSQGENEAHWSRRFYVQVRALKELDTLVRELKIRLSREGIESQDHPSPWNKSELTLVLKLIIAGAMYPQYFVQSSSDEARERDAVRTLGGHDPRNTVYLKNFPDNQPGEIYAASIRKAVARMISDEPRVFFDKNSQKVYLTFRDNQRDARPGGQNLNDPTIPGQVLLSVYKAIKARQLKMDIRIPMLPLDKANKLAEMLEEEKKNMDMKKFIPRLPDIDDTHFPLRITEKISLSKFWVQYDDSSTEGDLRQIQLALNRAPLLVHTGPVNVGDVFAGPFVDSQGTTLHRVRVLRILPRDMVQVIFIDFGNVIRLNVCNLYTLPAGFASECPPLAMQCVLAEIAPTPLLDQRLWSQRAHNLFNELTSKGHLLGKVYSVTHGVVSIELFADGGRVSINAELLKHRLAVPAEESYDSKLNHDLRQTAMELNLSQKRAFNKEQEELAYSCLRELDPPDARDCVSDAFLKGPFSPLETVVHNLMYSSRERQVTIEWNSVNSVLLDTEPQEIYERMLVAAEVGQNETSSKLTLRHTTLMPNIPGLPAIIALLFCPMAELRRDADGSRYVSALCGLGCTDDGAPYFPEHDLLVNIDAELSVEDIGKINHVRHLMDYIMSCGEEQEVADEVKKSRAQVPETIRRNIIELLRKRRKHREPQSVANAWEWKSAPEHECLEITNSDMVEGAVIYPLHVPLELHPLSRDQLLALKRENDQLKLLVSRMASSAETLSCPLCRTPPMPVHAMRIHLYSNAHRDKEDDFRIFQS